MLTLNPSTLAAVVDQALRDAAQHPRWIVAINRAVAELVSNPWIERGDHGLIIGSTSGKAYASNGICQCTAFHYGQACWHRAASRIVRLHDQAIEGQERRADIDARQAAAEAALDECFA